MKKVKVFAVVMVVIVVVAIGFMFKSQAFKTGLHSIESRLECIEATLEERYVNKQLMKSNINLDDFSVLYGCPNAEVLILQI